MRSVLGSCQSPPKVPLIHSCQTVTVKNNGYHEVQRPLIEDLVSLEDNGVCIEKLGLNIKGTVLYVAADNLAAKALAGFQEFY